MTPQRGGRRLRAVLGLSVAAILLPFAVFRPVPAAAEGAAPDSGRVALTPLQIQLPTGDQPLPVDFPSAIRLAGAKNLDIRQARARLEEQRGREMTVQASVLPSVSAGLNARHIDGEIQASFGELGRRSFSTIEPGVTVELGLNPGEAVFDLLAAHKRVEAGQYQEAQVTQTTLAFVASLYLQLLRAQAEVNIAVASVETAAELARLARDRQELDVGLEVDVARAEARLAREEGARARAEQRFRTASVDLADALLLESQVVLLPTESEVHLVTFVDVTEGLDGLLSAAVDRRPGLQELTRELDAADHRHTAAWWRGLGPEIYGAFEESGIARSFDVNNRQIYGGFVGWTLSASTVGEVRAAAARVEQAKLERERFERRIRSEVVKARDQVLAAQERIHAARRGLEAAGQSLRLSRDRFEGGVGLDLEVLEAQEALTDTRTAVIGAVVDYDVAQLRLILALGDVTAERLVDGFH